MAETRCARRSLSACGADAASRPCFVSSRDREPLWHAHESKANLAPARCGLTRRSSGAPTAGHQARAGGTRYIFASPGLASCRRRPLSSNVSPHKCKYQRSQPRRSSSPLCGVHVLTRGSLPAWGGSDATEMRKEWRLPSGKSSLLDNSMVSSWFALRAAVLRLAVSSLWTVALDKSRVVAAGVARRQNAAMVIRLNARAGTAVRLRPRQRCLCPCRVAAGSTVRANPAFKRTAYGRRLTPR